MTKLLSKELLALEKPVATPNRPVIMKEHLKIVEQGIGRTVVEFIGTGDFAAQWYDRQRFEVDAGRDQEPVLYTPLFAETVDPSLPRNVTVYRVGAGAVIMEEITEGGEVKFMTVEQSNYPVEMHHYAVGLEYSKDLIVYNELWNTALMERQVGVAYNALRNHIHLAPFIQFAYTSANQTAASALGTSLMEKWANTLDDAIDNASEDATNPRPGMYWLLCSPGNATKFRRLFTDVPQQGFSVRAMNADRIAGIIAYNGWTGRRGKKTVQYPGVESTKAYLIDVSDRIRNLRSFVKQELQTTVGSEDVSRFILEQVVWDAYFTMYADVAATTEEITLPTS